jgi:serine/threonine protein kinase
MDGKLQFRRVTGELVEAEAEVEDAEFPAGEFLMTRTVRLKNGPELRQHRSVGGSQRRDGYERLDNEIIAGRRLYEAADWGAYPPEVASLYGDEATSAEPYTLFRPYRGRPLREAAVYVISEEFNAFSVSLLTGLCWLAAAGIAHRAINLDTVLWDSQQRRVQITDFSRSTVFGVPRSPATGSSDWIPKEQRPRSCYGTVDPRDDIWAAGRLIFFVQNQGEDLVDRDQLTDLDQQFNGMFGSVLGPPEKRPTAWELLENGLRRRSPVGPASERSARLIAGRDRFLKAYRRRHRHAAVPPDFNQDIDWSGDPGDTSTVPPGSAGPMDVTDATPTTPYPQGGPPDASAGPQNERGRTTRSRPFSRRRGN